MPRIMMEMIRVAANLAILILIVVGSSGQRVLAAGSASVKRFIGAPDPAKSQTTSPLSPQQEQATFTLAPGFEIELVASESEGIGKFVTVDWDTRGRMWSMTALEYPVDAHESPEIATRLYASHAPDIVLGWDQPFVASPSPPHIFADGLGILPGSPPCNNG